MQTGESDVRGKESINILCSVDASYLRPLLLGFFPQIKCVQMERDRTKPHPVPLHCYCAGQAEDLGIAGWPGLVMDDAAVDLNSGGGCWGQFSLPGLRGPCSGQM